MTPNDVILLIHMAGYILTGTLFLAATAGIFLIDE